MTTKIDANWSRRRLLSGGVAAMGGLLLPSGTLRAQDGAALEAVGDMVSMAAKPGPCRIGFSNGFSGNSWRAMAIAALEAEAAATPDTAEFITVNGQGGINKQVNDIETMMNQGVDAILVIANSGTAAAPTGDGFNGLLKLYAAQIANQAAFDIGLMSEPT